MKYNGVEVLNTKKVINRLIMEYGLDENVKLNDFLKLLEYHDNKHMVTGLDLSSKNEVEYSNDK